MHTLLYAGAHAKLIDYAWCVLPHCPSASSCMFPHWGQAECESAGRGASWKERFRSWSTL